MYVKNTNCYFNVSQSLATLKALSSSQRVAQNNFGVHINELVANAKRADLTPVLRIEAANSETVEYTLAGYKPVSNGFVFTFVGSEDILTLTAYTSTENYGCSFAKGGSTVEVIPSITTPGVPIANIKVNGESNTLYAPENTIDYVDLTPLFDELIGSEVDTVLVHKEDLDDDQMAIVDKLRNFTEELYVSDADPETYKSIHNFKFFADDGDYEIGGSTGSVTEQYVPSFAKFGTYTDSETSDEMKEWHIGFYNQLPDSTSGGENAKWYSEFSIVSNLTSGDDDYDISITKNLVEESSDEPLVKVYEVEATESFSSAFNKLFAMFTPDDLTGDSKLIFERTASGFPSTIKYVEIYNYVGKFDSGYKFSWSYGSYESSNYVTETNFFMVDYSNDSWGSPTVYYVRTAAGEATTGGTKNLGNFYAGATLTFKA